MPEMPLANYHTHTPRCLHAVGTEEEYIHAALLQGYGVLGFSDHTPWDWRAMPYNLRTMRMRADELADYVAVLRTLREVYAGQLKLHIGLEAEYFPEGMPWLAEQREKLGIEYLLLGCHFDRIGPGSIYLGRPRSDDDIRRYADLVQSGLESGQYICLAHPDLFLNGCRDFSSAAETACRQICEAAVRTGTVLEYNLLGYQRHSENTGMLGYTNDRFWRIASEYPVRAIIGCDAHMPEAIESAAFVRERQAFLRGMGIEVLERMPGLD